MFITGCLKSASQPWDLSSKVEQHRGVLSHPLRTKESRTAAERYVLRRCPHHDFGMSRTELKMRRTAVKHSRWSALRLASTATALDFALFFSLSKQSNEIDEATMPRRAANPPFLERKAALKDVG